MEKPNVRFHDGQILSEEPLNKAMEAVDAAVDAANAAQSATATAEAAATTAQENASAAQTAATTTQGYVQEIKEAMQNLPDGSAVSAQVAVNKSGINVLGNEVEKLNALSAALKTSITYGVGAEIGRYEAAKNAQISTENIAYLSAGTSAYNCVVVETNIPKKIYVTYSADADERLKCGVIFANSSGNVIGKINTASYERVTKQLVNVPVGTDKIYINGYYNWQPSANEYGIQDVNVEVIKDIDEKTSVIHNDKLDLDVDDGNYINQYGDVRPNPVFCITTPFLLKAGQTVIFKAKGYQGNVAVLSQVLPSGYSPLCIGNDSYEEYSYTNNNEDMYVVLSYDKSEEQYIHVVSIPFDNKVKENELSLSMFERIGVVGDSYASGVIYTESGTAKYLYNKSWPQILSRKLGNACTCYSRGGLTTRTWLTDSKGLPFLLSSPSDEIYLLCLGINDYSLGMSYLGSINDINGHSSEDDYADTFYGNYGKIFEKIRKHSPSAKIIFISIVGEKYASFSHAVKEIADHYGVPFISQDDDYFFKSTLYTNMSAGHPRGYGYSGMANAFERLIVKCIRNNQQYFDDLFASE